MLLKFIFRFLFFFSFLFCFDVLAETGSCSLTQDDDLNYTIYCSGDGLKFRYEDITNEVYIIANCEELKHQLLSTVDQIYTRLLSGEGNVLNVSVDVDDALSMVNQSLNSVDSTNVVYELLLYAQTYLTQAADAARSVVGDFNSVKRSLKDENNTFDRSTLYGQINSLECGTCSEGDGSCCDVDLTPVIDAINSVERVDRDLLVRVTSLSNFVHRIYTSFLHSGLKDGLSYKWMDSDYEIEHDDGKMKLQKNVSSITEALNALVLDVEKPLSSVNNYLSYMTSFQLHSISNDLSNFVRGLDSYHTSVLGQYYAESTKEQSYYDFLTNYYIRVVNGDVRGWADLSYKTNWFARVEALIAALVFSDSPTTNSVGVEVSKFTPIYDHFVQYSTSPKERLDAFGDTSQSLVQSLRSINRTFSQVADPGTVRLFSLPSSDSRSGDEISFESSEIRSLVDVSRNVTTLCWVFVSLFVFYRFSYWAVRTSYNLLLFAWGIFTAIFHH